MKYFLIALIRAYQWISHSGLFFPMCRYYPSCSHYAVQAIEKHGSVYGIWLTIKRLGRCHPAAAGGWDAVP